MNFALAQRIKAWYNAYSFHRNYIGSGIEVVITGLTRNQFVSNHTWVRIPPAAPEKEVKKDFW